MDNDDFQSFTRWKNVFIAIKLGTSCEIFFLRGIKWLFMFVLKLLSVSKPSIGRSFNQYLLYRIYYHFQSRLNIVINVVNDFASVKVTVRHDCSIFQHWWRFQRNIIVVKIKTYFIKHMINKHKRYWIQVPPQLYNHSIFFLLYSYNLLCP